jgi:hypothetical protein
MEHGKIELAGNTTGVEQLGKSTEQVLKHPINASYTLVLPEDAGDSD